MEKQIKTMLEEGSELKLKFAKDCSPDVASAANAIVEKIRDGGKLYIFGNGGSAADAQHMQAELTHQFEIKRRKAIPCMAFTTNTSVLTAIGNDWGFDEVFSRQVENFVGPKDIVIGISTSGNSPNVKLGLEQAKKEGAATIGLLGKDGGTIKGMVDYAIVVSHENTARIQEVHLAVEHILCYLIEKGLSE